jgi:hypothetical protein
MWGCIGPSVVGATRWAHKGYPVQVFYVDVDITAEVVSLYPPRATLKYPTPSHDHTGVKVGL